MSWEELTIVPDWDLAAQVLVRVLIAAILGGAVGLERELKGKAAGLRTQMLVCMGATIVIVVARLDGIPIGDISRVIDGVLTGVGFIGGGVILKLAQDRDVIGITTAASIWAVAVIGIAVGLGQVWIAILSTVVVWIVLYMLGLFEKHVLKTSDEA
jgi:putative Mg2+ transporter-C (MgtC) family protein